jgi:hypothetical protein
VSRAGVFLAGAGVAVTAPRLVLAFLAAEGVAVEPGVHAQLQIVAAVAQALLLTGGGAYLAARAHAARSLLLGAAWAASTLLAVAVIAPTAYAGVSAYLGAVLPSVGLRWAYASALVLSVEVMAGACLIAAGIEQGQREGQGEPLPRPSGILGLGLAEALRVEASPLPAPALPLAEPLAEAHACPWCPRSFPTSAARDGHKRHCPARTAIVVSPEEPVRA